MEADRFTQALSGLASDASVTREPADQVATTLQAADPGGGHGDGRDLAAVATALSTSEEYLGTALRTQGDTLASLVEERGVSTGAWVEALVAAGRERLTQQVRDGVLTQEQADQRLVDHSTRITERVNATSSDRPQRSSEDDAPAADTETWAEDAAA